MTTSHGHDQDADPATSDGEDASASGPDRKLGDQQDSEEPGSHPDPDPGESSTAAGSDS